jgi:hypothetical protein
MKVEITGAATKIDAIFRFDKDVWKGVQRGVKEAAESVAADARSRFPSYGIGGTSGAGGWGGWIAKNGGRNLGYDQSKIRSSVKTRFKSRYKSGFREVKGQAVVMNPAGAIYSLAGSQNKSGHHFNNVINTQHGSNIWPRALTPAYYAKGPQASREIGRVIEKAISNINQA